MKNKLLFSIMVGAICLAINSYTIAPACAQEDTPPIKPEITGCEKPAPDVMHKPMSPEEHAKIREAKKAEFEARLNLSKAQKSQLEKIKKEEKTKLEPYMEKLKREQEKINQLLEQQKEIRLESIKKFEAMLTEEQKAELEKIKEEMQKFAPPVGPDGKPLPPKHHAKICPPDCNCGCHNPEQAPNRPDAPDANKPCN